MPTARLISGGLHRDGRGAVQHVNAFDFSQVDRFYTVKPARQNEVRGWVGHRRDWKWLFAVQGAFDVGVVEPDNWTAPNADLPVHSFRLAAEIPQILEVPPGLFAATLARTDEAILLILSSGQIADAASDDFRLPADYWKFPSDHRG